MTKLDAFIEKHAALCHIIAMPLAAAAGVAAAIGIWVAIFIPLASVL